MRQRRPSERGFTLIELMVVIVILGLLVSIVGPNVNRHLVQSRINAAKIQMSQLRDAVEAYRLEKRHLPDSLNDLVDGNGGGHLPGTEVPKDPWGNDYRFEKTDKKRFDIVCLGGDGQEGGEDDEDRDIHLADLNKSED